MHNLCIPAAFASCRRKFTMLIQDAMPGVPAPLREFVKSGITPEEWVGIFTLQGCFPAI